jgi:hypothetical protein
MKNVIFFISFRRKVLLTSFLFGIIWKNGHFAVKEGNVLRGVINDIMKFLSISRD